MYISPNHKIILTSIFYFKQLPCCEDHKFQIIIVCRDGDLPLIVAIDLQPMAPIEGVIQVQGDITNARTAEVVWIVNIFFCFACDSKPTNFYCQKL